MNQEELSKRVDSIRNCLVDMKQRLNNRLYYINNLDQASDEIVVSIVNEQLANGITTDVLKSILFILETKENDLNLLLDILNERNDVEVDTREGSFINDMFIDIEAYLTMIEKMFTNV
ncbi:gp599 [Bacillus phage G]|uniref:Gp599 n=1 Tax=Bacillus phage G TaxID=2884420 RepID=G3MAX9_9CAUD|nr:gp599 [Bacillus phage G]AEO93844.1 gp599 [Bacillus phage G]